MCRGQFLDLCFRKFSWDFVEPINIPQKQQEILRNCFCLKEVTHIRLSGSMGYLLSEVAFTCSVGIHGRGLIMLILCNFWKIVIF